MQSLNHFFTLKSIYNHENILHHPYFIYFIYIL